MKWVGHDLAKINESNHLEKEINKALKKGKEKEKRLIEQGWRWVKISSISKLLVPCDKNGNPTKQGLEKIKKYKEHLGIIY